MVGVGAHGNRNEGQGARVIITEIDLHRGDGRRDCVPLENGDNRIVRDFKQFYCGLWIGK